MSPKQLPTKGKSMKGTKSGQHTHGPHVDKYERQAAVTRDERRRIITDSTKSPLLTQDSKKKRRRVSVVEQVQNDSEK